MALEKLKILVETGRNQFGDEITVLFNPNQVTLAKVVNWRPAPGVQRDSSGAQFTHGDSATLTMDLFFDTFEDGTPVTEHTDQLFHLTTVEQHSDLHRPPLCQLQWGQFRFGDFMWVLENLSQRFTLFLSDGTPVRATLTCTFKQWRAADEEARVQDKRSADVVKTRTARRGDTLSSIAAEQYRDPTLWRPIAEANSIDDPRALKPGQVLVIPKLRTQR